VEVGCAAPTGGLYQHPGQAPCAYAQDRQQGDDVGRCHAVRDLVQAVKAAVVGELGC
jgi:hypothetical protein